MPNRVNELQVMQYKKVFADVTSVISIGYQKLTVKKTDVFRDSLTKKGLKILFVRNRLANIAFKELGLGEVMAICKEQTAFVWGEDPVSTARFLVDSLKEIPELVIHGGLVEKTILDKNRVIELSKSPTREELKSIISGQALSMGARVSAQVLAPARIVAGQIKKIADKEDEAAA